MESAVFGLIGVFLGALLTGMREWWFHHYRNRKDAEFLSIQVSCMLEKYAGRCAEVAGDDGLYMGQPDEEGYSSVQVATPKFEPDALKVEWKALPALLMHEILDFSNKAESADRTVDAAFEHTTPPDFDEGFEVRQFQYATLGIAASSLAEKLRRHVGLPRKIEGSEWNPTVYMGQKLLDIEARRKDRASRFHAPALAPTADLP